MRNIFSKVAMLAVIALAAIPGFSQVTLPSTTLSAAITGGNNPQDSFVVASVGTGATAMAVGDVLYIDREAMQLKAISSTTLTVNRGAMGTATKSHASGTTVYSGRPQWFSRNEQSGSCTSTAEAVLPVVNVASGNIFQCTASLWVVINGPLTTGTGLTALGPNAAGTIDEGSLDTAFRTNYLTSSINFEGATADTVELTVTAVDPTSSDATLSLPNLAGTSAAAMVSTLTTNNLTAANSVSGASNALVFEGATADAFETSVTPADPTADRTITIPNGDGTIMVSSLATNAVDAANSVTGASNGLVFEGATADAFELTLAPADATADATITLPNGPGTVMLSSLATNAVDAANSVTGASNALVLEGATADAFETSVAPQDPTADRTVTVPNANGIINVGPTFDVIFCGDLPNNTTLYYSPANGYGAGLFNAFGGSYALAGAGCAAEDNATEGTADEVMYANNALKILGMACTVTSSGSNGVVINMRSATASLTPDVTITIPTATTTGATVTGSTTDISAGATVAIRVIATEDLSAQDVWCLARIMVVP